MGVFIQSNMQNATDKFAPRFTSHPFIRNILFLTTTRAIKDAAKGREREMETRTKGNRQLSQTFHRQNQRSTWERRPVRRSFSEVGRPAGETLNSGKTPQNSAARRTTEPQSQSPQDQRQSHLVALGCRPGTVPPGNEFLSPALHPSVLQFMEKPVPALILFDQTRLNSTKSGQKIKTAKRTHLSFFNLPVNPMVFRNHSAKTEKKRTHFEPVSTSEIVALVRTRK
jgi:hypothetical protein